MMTTTPITRKERFVVALRRAGLTKKEFARDEGVTRTHLYLVLEGDRPSERLNTAIDAFLERWDPQ